MKNNIQHYNHRKYWKYKDIAPPPNKVNIITKIIALYCLFYVKRCDAFNCASTGADLFAGAVFKTPPSLPHGLNGIIFNPYVKVGSNCIIFHQVTLGDDGKECCNAPSIGDNVIIGAGAKIIGKIHIGDNVVIGAGAIVVTDVPDNCIVISPKATCKIRK